MNQAVVQSHRPLGVYFVFLCSLYSVPSRSKQRGHCPESKILCLSFPRILWILLFDLALPPFTSKKASNMNKSSALLWLTVALILASSDAQETVTSFVSSEDCHPSSKHFHCSCRSSTFTSRAHCFQVCTDGTSGRTHILARCRPSSGGRHYRFASTALFTSTPLTVSRIPVLPTES